MGAKDADPKPPTVGYWAVAYLDLLGYRRALQSFDVYPLPSRSPIEKFARAAYFPKCLVDGVNRFMAAVATPTHSAPSHLPSEVQSTAAAWRRTRIGVLATGDAVVLRAQLYGDHGHFPPSAIDTMLTAACAASLLQLATGSDDPEDTLPIRFQTAPGGLSAFARAKL